MAHAYNDATAKGGHEQKAHNINFKMKQRTIEMVMSINTNAGALYALQTLTKTNMQLSTTQSRINTGLKVATAKDNGAVFAIAQNLRSDVAGLSAAKDSLDRATSTIDVALAAGEAIGDLLLEMKDKVTAAADASLDATSRSALEADYKQLEEQIATITSNAEFNGTNMVKNTGDAVSAIIDTKGASTITVAAQDLTSAGLGVTTSATAFSTAAAATTAAAALDLAVSSLSTKMATMGAGSKRFAISKEFVTKLSDAIQVGIGNLVDADMAKESANLQAFQVKQQLGLQALSIANQAPGTVLGLFRG